MWPQLEVCPQGLKEITVSPKRNSPDHIAQRRSQRVPFGTGRSTITISGLLQENKPYCVFDPLSFVWLKDLLEKLQALSEHKNLPQFIESLPSHFVPPLEELGLIQDFKNILPLNNTWYHLNTAFDGLKTIQWLRKLSASVLPLVELDRAMGRIGESHPAMIR